MAIMVNIREINIASYHMSKFILILTDSPEQKPYDLIFFLSFFLFFFFKMRGSVKYQQC